MQLKCPNCGETIPARQINVEKLVAICPHCDAVFNVEPDALASKSPGRKRRKVPQPENFNVIEDGGKLQISYLYRENLGWLEYLLAVFFSVISLAGFIGSGVILSLGHLLPVLFVMPLVFVLIYLTASIFVNWGDIQMDEDSLTFDTGPLPILSNKKFDTHEVVRVYTKAVGFSGNPSDDYYHVMVELDNGVEKTFLDFEQRSHADYIVQMLEEYLKNDANVHDNPFIDADESVGESAGSTLADGEIITGEADEDVPVALDDLLRSDDDAQQHRSS